MQHFKRKLMCLLAGAGVSAAMANAQLTSSARISRPSEQGPSALVGRVGGSNTQYFNSSTANSRTRFDYQNGIGLGGGNFGGSGGLRGSGRGSMGILSGGSAIRSGPPMNIFGGIAGRRGGIVGDYSRDSFSFGAGDIFRASGLEDATSVDLPLVGWESPRIDGGDAPVYIAPSDASAFHDFFGLRPSTANLRSEPPPANTLQSELLERVNSMDVSDLIEKGKRELKLGTTDGNPDRQEYLARAYDNFASARRIDPKAWLPCLLAVHCSIEKAHAESAYFMLGEAVRRNARAIVERPNFEELYGSKLLLDVQLRSRLQMGAQQPSSAQAAVFEAYASLLLNDKARAASAVRRLEELNRIEADENVEMIRRALLAALQ